MFDFVDACYRNKEGLRYWPEGELVRFVGKTYGQTYGFRGDPARIALDLGCRTGRNSWLLYESGFDVHAIDQSSEAVKLANEYLVERTGVHGIVLQTAELSSCLQASASNHYDLVIDVQTLQHVSEADHVRAYREIGRVLKVGGRFWTMHFRYGDTQAIYGGYYPELEAIGRQSFIDRLSTPETQLRLESVETVTKSYLNGTAELSWWVASLVKR